MSHADLVKFLSILRYKWKKWKNTYTLTVIYEKGSLYLTVEYWSVWIIFALLYVEMKKLSYSQSIVKLHI